MKGWRDGVKEVTEVKVGKGKSKWGGSELGVRRWRRRKGLH